MSKSVGDAAKEIQVLDQLHGEIDRLELERQRIQYLCDCSAEGTQTKVYLSVAIASVIQAQRSIHHVIVINTTDASKQHANRNGEQPAGT